jgi:NADH:ubiquinone oxidoreductase subunit 5 (subunit L)/multisubunit Na+/H+ antiporter MnhA subunit
MLVDVLACLIPLGPLLACLVTLLWGARVLRENCHWPAILGCGLSSLCSLALVLTRRARTEGPFSRSNSARRPSVR